MNTNESESDRPYECPPETGNHIQWMAVLGASLIAGFVLLVVPRASPWSGLTFFAPVVMGRVVPEELGMPVVLSKLFHLGLSLLYGFVIALVVSRITKLWAVLAGAVLGGLLYLVNFAFFRTAFPQMLGDEWVVAFAHFFFGGIMGGAYRGLLRRRVPAQVQETPA
jgi:hypothetical protein